MSGRVVMLGHVLLAVWPKLEVVLRGSWRQYRGVPVESLGQHLYWDDFARLGNAVSWS